MKEEKNKLADANFEKELFTITIKVNENVASLTVATPEGVAQPTYHQIIGALEAQKIYMVFLQSEKNVAEYREFLRVKNNPTNP